MTDLSPQAQAVLDAFLKAPMGQSHVDDDLIAIAAALRAAAYEIDWESGDPKLLLEGIADELESGNG